MRIVFFGTPDFAVPSLQILYRSKHKIVGVVTASDKPRGRGRNPSSTPIKEFASRNNMKLFTPEDLHSETFEQQLRELEPDLFAVVAFRILPENIFTIPDKGAFNLHGSLLPKYRGAAPIQWALINGETETGLTTFFLKKKVDTGNIILQRKISIEDSDNFGTLHDKMSMIGAELVLETVDQIDRNEVNISYQDDGAATPAPKITKEICEIRWNEPAEKIFNLIRGLAPYPGAYFNNKSKSYKVFSSKINYSKNLEAGEIQQSKNEILIGTKTYTLNILELQPEGRKRMTAAEFLRGYAF